MFNITLGMLEAARGAAYMASSSRTLHVGSALDGIASISVVGVRLPFFAATLACAAAMDGR